MLFSSQWFSSLFTFDFPLETTTRVWDVFFVEGITWIFKVFALSFSHLFSAQVVLGILLELQPRLLGLPLDVLLARIKTEGPLLPTERILHAAHKISFANEDVQTLRDEFNDPSMKDVGLFL
jgi:hypothetical protein